MVVRALEKLRPDAVLVEGPPDAAQVLPLAAATGMKPPVALLVYEPDEPRNASYYPFAEFSPEWQAIRWGQQNAARVSFIDLPQALRGKELPSSESRGPGPESQGPSDKSAPEPNSELGTQHSALDPLDQLALAAGYPDGEAWWGRLIEERRGDHDPLAVFDAIREAMAELRSTRDTSPPHSAPGTRPSALRNDPDEPAREAHMRRCIRAALKEHERVAVVCGAWHAPVLTADALKHKPVKADDEVLRPLTRRKTTATWVPWTYDRLSMFSGYGAGVLSPGWYEHLWLNHARFSETWLTKVARLMRDEDLDASPASVIEAVRLADSLAALRGHSIAGLPELSEATLAILCHANPLPMKVIERKLIIGVRLGEVPEDAPAVPLQRDLAAEQKSLRLKVTADDQLLDLDQRKDIDLARSRLLHRLAILGIPWGKLEADQRQRASSFHEVWRLQWRADFAVAVIEAARYGNTVLDAAAACVRHHTQHASSLAALTTMLDHVMLADLPAAVEHLVARIQELSAVGADVGTLMVALPPLARVLRYGNVRKTDAALVAPLVAGLLTRICTGLLPACGALDDDAAHAMRSRIDDVQGSLSMLDDPALTTPWHDALRRVGNADMHGLVVGRCWRILLDSGASSTEDASGHLSLALSPGNDPAKASAWLEGFLAGSGMVLAHDDRLLAIIDQWVTTLRPEIFDQVCPIARRTFSSFEPPERRQIGERLKRAGAPGPTTTTHAAAVEDYDPARGSLVEPVLNLILGKEA
ncbi:MAG TPA: DUF5682 family protein [Phycisphaerales bacterium]|nr:DUF5682 family protein [Phycisphaerales bacterium]